MTEHPDRLITTKEAAAILAVQPNTLATWRSESRSPVKAIVVGGRAVRYRLSDIQAYIASQCEDSGEAA